MREEREWPETLVQQFKLVAQIFANAPNPAGQSLLKKYFNNAVSPMGPLKAALLPTVIAWLCFAVFR
jgi:hypothetical protein